MNASRRITVLYDSQCAMCRGQMRLLARLDWFRHLSPMAAADPRALGAAAGLTCESLLEAIHCVTPEGRVHRGARCFRHLAMRLPLLMPLGLVLWIPGCIRLAERIYRRVSRNRHALSRWFADPADATAPAPAADKSSLTGR